MPEAELWVVRAGKGGRRIADFETKGLIAIGFHLHEDISGLSRKELTTRIDKVAPGKKERVAGDAGALFRFANEIRKEDIVVVPDGATRELLFGRVKSEYIFRPVPEIATWSHYREVEWIGRRPRDSLPKRVLYSLGAISTIFKPAGVEALLALLENKPIDPEVDLGPGEMAEGSDTDILADLQSRSEELVGNKLAQLDGYEMQDLVAGILRAMGFHTRVSPPGADRGVDIVASRDPLGVDQPVKVQVKARPTTRSSAQEVRELAGVLGAGEKGIFVSSGGFTKEALMDPSANRVTFIDGERLQELLVDYYDRLEQDSQSLVPLRRIYFPLSD